MKYEYKRSAIKIKYWFVSKDHIKRLLELFKKRFSDSDLNFELQTESGNNRIYENYEEFVEDIPILLSDKERVSKILILQRDGSIKSPSHYRQAWVILRFGEYSEASINVMAGDSDRSNKDWTSGMYEDCLKLKEIFEEKDPEIIEQLQVNEDGVVFDPDWVERNSIVEFINKNSKITTDAVKSSSGEILKLKPEFHGIGIDLKLLFKKIFNIK